MVIPRSLYLSDAIMAIGEEGDQRNRCRKQRHPPPPPLLAVAGWGGYERKEEVMLLRGEELSRERG